MRRKYPVGKPVRVTWVDITEDSSWTTEEELTLVTCESFGVLYDAGEFIRLITSKNSSGDVSGLAIPKGCIEDISVLVPEKK